MNSGANVLRQMEHKNQNFIINIGDTPKTFQFYQNDPIFTLESANEDTTAEQNPYCNCCEEQYKSHKDAKYC